MYATGHQDTRSLQLCHQQAQQHVRAPSVPRGNEWRWSSATDPLTRSHHRRRKATAAVSGKPRYERGNCLEQRYKVNHQVWDYVMMTWFQCYDVGPILVGQPQIWLNWHDIWLGSMSGLSNQSQRNTVPGLTVNPVQQPGYRLQPQLAVALLIIIYYSCTWHRYLRRRKHRVHQLAKTEVVQKVL